MVVNGPPAPGSVSQHQLAKEIQLPARRINEIVQEPVVQPPMEDRSEPQSPYLGRRGELQIGRGTTWPPRWL